MYTWPEFKSPRTIEGMRQALYRFQRRRLRRMKLKAMQKRFPINRKTT